MSAGISIRVIGLAELQARMRKTIDEAPGEINKAVLKGALLVASQAQRNVSTPGGIKGGAYARARARGGGTGLHVQTGRLRASIGTELVSQGIAKVGTNVVYARIHEYGGKIGPRVIRAKAGGWLAFQGKDGGMVFRRSVNWPGAVIPARPYLRPALATMRPKIITLLRQVFNGIIRVGDVESPS